MLFAVNLKFHKFNCVLLVYLQGGAPCRFTFSPRLQPEVTSGRAMFGNVAPIELERMKNGSLLGTIPGLFLSVTVWFF